MTATKYGLSPFGFFLLAVILFLAGIWLLLPKPTEGFESEHSKDSDHIFVMYYSPSCGHCIRAKPEFMKLGKQVVISGKPVHIMFVNPKTEPEHVFGGPTIRGYPTIRLYGPGFTFIEEYEDDRTHAAFLQFLQKKVQ